MDWHLAALTLLGILLVAHRRISGFLVQALASIGWLLYGIDTDQSGIASLNCALLLANVYAFITWRRAA